ncbi:hypothetical protein ACFQ2Y_16455 [Streptomyces malaysiensis subsp. malaysiensis]
MTPRVTRSPDRRRRETRYPATVRFTDPDGRTRTAKAEVLPGLAAGSSVHVWVDKDGAIAEPPMPDAQIRSRTMGWALIAFVTVTLAGAAVYRCTTVVLRRRNLAEWDTEWAETAPRWTTSPEPRLRTRDSGRPRPAHIALPPGYPRGTSRV